MLVIQFMMSQYCMWHVWQLSDTDNKEHLLLSKASSVILQSSVFILFTTFSVSTLTENCILMSNFDISTTILCHSNSDIRFCLKLPFHTSHIVFLPNTVSFYEWICVINSLTAFVWRSLIGWTWNKIQSCKFKCNIGFEYIAYNMQTNNLNFFEDSKDTRFFVSYKFFTATEKFL